VTGTPLFIVVRIAFGDDSRPVNLNEVEAAGIFRYIIDKSSHSEPSTGGQAEASLAVRFRR
jgi:hypothetical protein